MNNFLKKLTISQLEEILSIFGKQVDINRCDIEEIDGKLKINVTNKNFVGCLKNIEQNQILDDYALENCFSEKCYKNSKNSFVIDNYAWDDYNKYLFILKMYDIFGQVYLDECPKEAKKAILKLLKSEIEILEIDRKNTFKRIEDLRNTLAEKISNENKRILLIDKMTTKTNKIKDLLDEEIEER